MFGPPPRHQRRNIGRERIEFVNQQVEHIVDGVDDTGIGQPAPMLAQQGAQHPDGAHHLVAAHFAIAQLPRGQQRNGLGPHRNHRTGGLGVGRRGWGVQRFGHHPDQQFGIIAVAGGEHLDLRRPAVPDQRQLGSHRRMKLRRLDGQLL